MQPDKLTFALFFGNRGNFPASLQVSARAELLAAMAKLGHDSIALSADATATGAVDGLADGRKYAEFLRANHGTYHGVILCLPNFGDENGAMVALKDAGVPILVQAYPDEMDRLGPSTRRDAFCGKFSVMNTLGQAGVPFTALTPHVAHPAGEAFAANMDHFARVCRVVGGLKSCSVGAIGARTTPFKTVRFDEVALQRHGVTCETVDLSEVFSRVGALKDTDAKVRDKARELSAHGDWSAASAGKLARAAALALVLDEIVAEYRLDAVSIRCWVEVERELGITPCAVMGALTETGTPAACEVDVCGALMMLALSLAAGCPPALLDWNNNYGDEADKCILFHCGPLPQSMMAPGGRVAANPMLPPELGSGCGWGCNVGRIRPGEFTFGGLLTDAGRLKTYLGNGRFTEDAIPSDFFGVAGVAEIEQLQDKLQRIGLMGHRHHVAVAPGRVLAPLAEALERYLGYEVAVP